jgi:hypothetical protein
LVPPRVIRSIPVDHPFLRRSGEGGLAIPPVAL